MPVTREFVNSLSEGKEKKYYEDVLKDMIANDEWALKINKDVGVLLTAHPGSRPFLKSGIETHKKLGYWLILSYDNYFNPNNKKIDYNSMLPKREVFDQIDTFIISHHQTWGGVLYPYFWLLKLGLETMGNFKYVFCSNGDCILEKPEGFPKIMEMLGDADIMGCGWEENNGRPLFNGTSFIAKTEAARAIIRHFQNYIVPFKMYEKHAQRMGNTESRFQIAIDELGLKQVKVPKNPYNTQLHVNKKTGKPEGTWYDILGFRHIHGEYNGAKKYGTPFPPEKYIDKEYFR